MSAWWQGFLSFPLVLLGLAMMWWSFRDTHRAIARFRARSQQHRERIARLRAAQRPR